MTTSTPLPIVAYDALHAASCASLLESVPEWFGIPEANAAYLANLGALPSWVALRENDVAGAVTLEEHFPGSFEIHFMAVRRACHRQGIGRSLVEHVEREARRRGGRLLHVKTLAASHPDPGYGMTRAFYQAMGFAPLFESSRLWDPRNPALVLVKPL